MENISNIKKRVLFIDILKLLAIIPMPTLLVFYAFLHTNIFTPSFPIESITNLMSFLCIFVQAMLVFCIGCGFGLSKATTYKPYLKKAAYLAMLGAIVNIVRYVIPAIIIGFTKENTSFYLISAANVFLQSNIFYFASLIYLAFALFKKYNLSDYWILYIGVLLSILQFAFPIGDSNTPFHSFIGNFFYANEYSIYPVISWFIYPASGYTFMNRFRKNVNKDKYVNKVGAVALGVLVILFGFLNLNHAFDSTYILWGFNGFRMELITTVFTITILLAYITAIYHISKLIDNEQVINAIYKDASQLTPIFVIQCLLISIVLFIMICSNFTGIEQGISLFLIGSLILVFSILLSNIYTVIKSNQE